jgi:alpha-tubulin suppressor-like RCC1 family protein
LTENKIFALSSSGHIYVLASRALDQIKAPGAPTPSSDGWWGTGWLWGEDQAANFAQLTSNEPLNWREKFTSIAAGKDHLLALTSTGRTFAHPISKKANTHGQLGFTNFAVPDPAATIAGLPGAHLHITLTPKSVSDPNWKASRSVRVASDSEKQLGDEDLAAVHDKRVGFCPFIYEVPALRGIPVEQIAAGARTSFVRTPNGRVLGWGANEFGQLGLGDKVTLDTITIPTEVVLWRAISRDLDTNCTHIAAGRYYGRSRVLGY